MTPDPVTVHVPLGDRAYDVRIGAGLIGRAGAEIAVMEVGLGGRLDATNALEPKMSVITNVALDHTEVLGATEAAIAAAPGCDHRPRQHVDEVQRDKARGSRHFGEVTDAAEVVRLRQAQDAAAKRTRKIPIAAAVF